MNSDKPVKKWTEDDWDRQIVPRTFMNLEPKSFDYVLEEVVACLFPIRPDRSPGEVGTLLYANSVEHARQLLLRAQYEYDKGRTEQAWPFLAEAHGIGQKYDGFEEARLFADRVDISEYQTKIGKVGGTNSSKKYREDRGDNEKLVAQMEALPIDPAWSREEHFRAVLVSEGDKLGIELESPRVNGLLKDPRIKAIMKTAKALKE